MRSRARMFAGVVLLLLFAAASRCGSSPTDPAPPAGCSYTFLSGGAQSFGATGGTGSVSVSASTGCTWTVSADHAWVTFPGGTTGTGNTPLSFAVAENTGTAVRETNVTIEAASQRFVVKVVQAGRSIPCEYTAATTSQRFSAAGGKGTVSVTATAGCSWEATSTESWLTFEGATQGTGNGTVTYVIAPWTGPAERSAAVRVGGREVTIRQDPPVPLSCEYSVSPTSFTMHWHETGHDIQVQTSEGCTWTVTSDTSWLSVSGASSRSGPGTVTFTAPEFVTGETTRSAPVMIRWPTASQGQNVWVTHEGCRYAFQHTTRAFAAAGGSDHLTVFRDPVSESCPIGCTVTPQVSVTWITDVRVVASDLMRSDAELYFKVDANTSSLDRTGTIKVGDKVLTITQSR